ncbi:MAG: hypothetical protein JWM11_7296 [Planctomycetaceae bacterium]|nr:hypothetical protein [Planctomycetaceae bacterium]
MKFDLKSNIPDPTHPPIEPDDNFEILHLSCCNETIKIAKHNHYFCTICGTEFDMTINDSKKVFLSHKGVDKGKVNEFKHTLAILGYHPWIDEDAMPAGTALERGLLRGMQESCGVVFFITPSFKDEGFLETEVNYAIQEKRKKGDKFAIIALQFVDNDGTVGQIPELLTTYVWKKPKSSLEALREIDRALPVAPKLIDWRDGIDGVITTPIAKSTSTELSTEAKALLKVAAAGDGRIMHFRYASGEEISVAHKSMLPDQNSRTIALWVGGLEDLQRRRFIKAVGHKGEIFEVTREGYEAADDIDDK